MEGIRPVLFRGSFRRERVCPEVWFEGYELGLDSHSTPRLASTHRDRDQ